MTGLVAMTWVSACFFWVAVSFVLVGAWCAAIEITIWRNRRRVERRRVARGGFLYDRERERIGL